MLRSEAARYARWSAAVALLLASATAAVYLKRGWTSHVERKHAPPPAPLDVTRQSAGITFKKFDEQNHIIFTVDASKSTDFKDQDASLLEDVRITIFGKAADRNDVIHTKSCQYGKEHGDVTCSGDVQLDLLSAADAKRTANNPEQARALMTRVETRGINFDRSTGIARTDQRVIFAFPNGSGDAIGMQYNSDEGTVQLLREVRLRLMPLAPANPGKSKASGISGTAKSAAKSGQAPKAQGQKGTQGQEVHVKGSSLEFARDSRRLRLHGPAEAETAAERLTAQEILLTLNEDFRAEKLVASGGSGTNRPELTTLNSAEKGSAEKIQLQADTLIANLSPEGSVTQLQASGAVHGLRSGGVEEDEANSDSGVLEMWPRIGQPKELNLSGNVVLKSDLKQAGEARALQTSAFRMTFGSGKPGESTKPSRAETLAAGTMEWTDAATQGAPGAHTRLQADRLAMDFAEQGKPRQLQATGNVQTERRVAGHPVQTATAQSGTAQMAATGGWTQMDLHGNVKLRDGDRAGQADHATFVRAAQTAVLTGRAVARDANTETHAPRITFAQASGDIVAEGGVRSTDFSSKSSDVQLAPAPANITGDSLQANSKAGRAQYTGHARLWQGDSVLEANSIELLRETRVLNANGNVRAVFPQAANPKLQNPTEPVLDSGARTINVGQPTLKKPQLWHTSSGSLVYQDKEGQAHLEKNVVVQSADQKMLGPVLDLYFTRAPTTGAAEGSVSNHGTSNSAASSGGANPAGGSQQISRAVGTGGVTVEQGGRKATADRGEYTAASGKFVMSGGNPTLYDGSSGTTTGRQLTFFLADDTIIVDSENGSRTLTKHRVEK
jgi:LPS export ABC transporter protein LptC